MPGQDRKKESRTEQHKENQANQKDRKRQRPRQIKVFFTGDARQLEEFYALIVKMLKDLEPFENEEIPENPEALIINLKNIISYLKQNRHDFYADDLPNVLYGLQLLVESIEIAVSGDQDSLENLLVDNWWFNRFWGSPVHYLLLRKVA